MNRGSVWIRVWLSATRAYEFSPMELEREREQEGLLYNRRSTRRFMTKPTRRTPRETTCLTTPLEHCLIITH